MQNKQIYVIGAILSIVLTGCSLHSESNIVQTADSLLWSNPDSCIAYCMQNRETHATQDNMILSLKLEHAKLKNDRQLDSDSVLLNLEHYFKNHNDHRHLGEVYYVLGTAHSVQQENRTGTHYLKKAEQEFLEAPNIPNILWGMLYFQFGYLSQEERLYSIARDYQQKAISYLSQEAHHKYTAAAYISLAMNQEEENISDAITYIDSALFYSSLIESPTLYKETELRKYQYILEKDTDIILNNLTYLCDSCKIYYYAAELTSHYLASNDLSLAESYLEKLKIDTASNAWSKEQYYLLQAEILQRQNRTIEALSVMKRLYEWLVLDMENSAFDRTYIISQKYDAAREQELRLQETVKKQRAYIWIAFCMLLCILIGGYSYYKYKKGQYELKLGEEEKKRMAQELETHKAILRTRISERLQVARKIHSWGSHHEEKIPEELNILSPSQAARDVQNWKRFYDEFNLCFDNLLLKLQEKHPDLTDSDLQYIALTFLGFDITDLCFLLGITNRTIWNRRSIVKQHLNLPEGENQDEWIVKEMPQEFGLIEQEAKRKKKNTKRQRK